MHTPFSTFTESFTSFVSSLFQVFGRLLGPRFFDSPKGPLAHKKTFIPITFGGIKLILTTTIIPTSYLGDHSYQVHSQLTSLPSYGLG